MGKAAIYPGTFDPISNGHVDIIKRATHVFDKVIVAVANNTHKHPLFTMEERLEMVKQATEGIERIQVDSFDGLVIDYAHHKNIRVVIRGIRMFSDFEYEFRMALTNRRLAQDIETVFLMPSENFSFFSSTLLKETAAYGADISSLVPKFIEKKLKERLKR